jgi:hypothetical protein
MADEPSPLDMEKIGEVDDPKVLEAEIERRKGTPAAPVAEPKKPEIVVEPEKPAEPAPAPTEPKPAEPAPAAAEPKPAEPAPAAAAKPAEEPQRTRDDAAWKRVRLLEKELKELREAREKPPEKPAGPPAFDDDPALNLKARADALEGEVVRLRAENQQKQQDDAVRAQEAEFSVVKPDYKQALAYLETTEVNEWQESGAATAYVRQLQSAVAAGRRGDTAFKGYADHVDKVAAQPHVQQMAAKDGRDPDDVAMFLVARDTYLTSRRQLVRQGAEATGRNPAEIAYKLAEKRGYKPTAPVTEPAKPAQESPEAARQRVLAQKEITAATNSLSESATVVAGPERHVLRNRNDVLNLDEASLDALIESGQYRNL